MEAVILAGGMGTRLKSVVSNLPKPMAVIDNKPFLSYLFELLIKYECKKVILATGYKHERIYDFFRTQYKNIAVEYSIEDEPLGTGGAIKKALIKLTDDHVLLLNGDTFFNVDINLLFLNHRAFNADLTMALKPMREFSRYGNVVIDSAQRVLKFDEKKYVTTGYINGGFYLLKPVILDKFALPDKFSFESDFLEKYLEKINVRAVISDSYFIDIGIPEDYYRAQLELKNLLEHD
jgi:D-glycero-alpha-D-manno-heptose 1-phosphate guanylyltransferase